MSTYFVSIGEREYNVKVTGSQVLLNDEPVDLDLVSLNRNGLHLVCEGNQSREVYLGAQSSGVYEVISGGRRVIAKVDHAHRRSRSDTQEQNVGHIFAPMPGIVVELLVDVGDCVTEGQVLAVQEAMKMQMQLKSPFTGTVEHIAVGVGAPVGKGALILRLYEA